MKTTYYYSYKINTQDWDIQPQYLIEFKDYESFVNFCYGLSFHLKKEIRGCTSKGYNNQGTYFFANQANLNSILVQ